MLRERILRRPATLLLINGMLCDRVEFLQLFTDIESARSREIFVLHSRDNVLPPLAEVANWTSSQRFI